MFKANLGYIMSLKSFKFCIFIGRMEGRVREKEGGREKGREGGRE
jgi:hypothetical protein